MSTLIVSNVASIAVRRTSLAAWSVLAASNKTSIAAKSITKAPVSASIVVSNPFAAVCKVSNPSTLTSKDRLSVLISISAVFFLIFSRRISMLVWYSFFIIL